MYSGPRELSWTLSIVYWLILQNCNWSSINIWGTGPCFNLTYLNDLRSGVWAKLFELPHDKTNKMACALSQDSDQPWHPPSLIRVFAVHMKKAWVLSYPLSAQRRLWSDWVDAQAYLSLRWALSHFVGFVMRWLIYTCFRPKPIDFQISVLKIALL